MMAACDPRHGRYLTVAVLLSSMMTKLASLNFDTVQEFNFFVVNLHGPSHNLPQLLLGRLLMDHLVPGVPLPTLTSHKRHLNAKSLQSQLNASQSSHTRIGIQHMRVMVQVLQKSPTSACYWVSCPYVPRHPIPE